MMQKSLLLRTVVPALLAGTGMIRCTDRDAGVAPEVKPLIEAVYASGFVVTKDEYQVFAQVDGYLAEKLADDGEAVGKGDPLFVIESGQQPARYRIAKEAYDLAVRNNRQDSPVLREIMAMKESAFTKMQFDSVNLVRYANLLDRNATTKAEFDRIRLASGHSRNEYALQKSRLEKARDQLDLELQHAKNQLVIAGDESGRYIVRSSIDGVVLMTVRERGELIRRSEVIATIGKKDAFYLQLHVDELDVQRVAPGQEALVKIDAYPGTIFHGVVTRIYPMVDRRQQSVRVDAELQEPLPGKFSGLALEANIIIRKKENAAVIPKDKLLSGDSVILRTEDGPRKVKVTTGIETLDEVEILSANAQKTSQQK